jgi:hypothetical protein
MINSVTSLIILFIITGAIFLVSTSDLVSIFLSIELQSYGLYLLSTLYRNSELATSGGLTYFLLGVWQFRTLLLCLLLSNSGDTLKLMVPNYRRKAISGWTNNSGMVTSHMMNENEMGYRGSKSVTDIQNLTGQKSVAVKEQRVDGSWYSPAKQYLRCTLMGFERNYQTRVLSNQISVARFYTTKVQCPATDNSNMCAINPNWLTGFADGL